MKKVLLFLITFLIVLNVGATTNENNSITYFSLNGSEKIIISKESDYKPKLNKVSGNSYQSSDIEIKDYTVYQGIFMTNESSKYPMYIIETNDEYLFSDFRKSDNAIKNTYILSTKIHTIITSNAATNISSCENLFGYQLINLLKNNVFKIIYYIIPIILIITSTFDFARLVFLDDKDGIPGAFKKLLRRVIASVLIFLVPTILIFLTNLIGSDEVKTCIETFRDTNNLSESN